MGVFISRTSKKVKYFTMLDYNFSIIDNATILLEK